MPAIYSLLLLIAPQAAQGADAAEALQAAQITAERKLRYSLEECARTTRTQYAQDFGASNTGTIRSDANRVQQNCVRRAEYRYRRDLELAVRRQAKAEADAKAQAQGQ